MISLRLRRGRCSIAAEHGELSSCDVKTADTTRSGSRRAATIVFGVIPAVVILLAAFAGALRWQGASRHDAQDAAQESTRVAAEAAVALLSYQPDSVQADLESARSNLTGDFLDSYNRLIHELVIPGAQEKQISAVATVPAAASTSATSDRAVVLVFVNQTTTIGADAPTSTASTVRVTLDRVEDRWLVSQFEPVGVASR